MSTTAATCRRCVTPWARSDTRCRRRKFCATGSLPRRSGTIPWSARPEHRLADRSELDSSERLTARKRFPLRTGSLAEGAERNTQTVASVCGSALTAISHFPLAAAGCAGGLNDALQTDALLQAIVIIDGHAAAAATGVAMLLVGVADARKAARTLSDRIAPLDIGQGRPASLTTALRAQESHVADAVAGLSRRHVSIGTWRLRFGLASRLRLRRHDQPLQIGNAFFFRKEGNHVGYAQVVLLA